MKHLKWVLAKAGYPLDDGQKTQIRAIFQGNREQMKGARADLFKARRDLQTAILTAGQALTSEQINSQVANMMTQISAMAVNRAVIYNQIVWNVLNNDQRAALLTQANSKPVQQ